MHSSGVQREALGHRADRALAVAEPGGAAPVERDAVGHHRVAPGLAQRGAVGDEAVEAAVGHRDDDRDHLALGRAQPRRLLVQQPEVREPRRQPLGAEGVGLEHVRDEPDLLARLAEQALELGREVGLVGDGEPGDAIRGGVHRRSVATGAMPADCPIMRSDDSPSARSSCCCSSPAALGRHGRRPSCPPDSEEFGPGPTVGIGPEHVLGGVPERASRRRRDRRARGPPHPAHRHARPRARRVRPHPGRPLRRGAGDGDPRAARLVRRHRGRRPRPLRDRRGLPAARLDRRAAARGDRDPRARRRARRRVRRRRRRLQRRHHLRARPLDRRARPRRRRPGRRRRDLPLQARRDGRGRVRRRAHAGHAAGARHPGGRRPPRASCWRR